MAGSCAAPVDVAPADAGVPVIGVKSVAFKALGLETPLSVATSLVPPAPDGVES